jgi:putative membrane protein
MMYYATGMGFLGWLFMIVFWIVVIWVLFSLFRCKEPRNSQRALNILQERYAKGEITKKKYEEIKEDIYGQK